MTHHNDKGIKHADRRDDEEEEKESVHVPGEFQIHWFGEHN